MRHQLLRLVPGILLLFAFACQDPEIGDTNTCTPSADSSFTHPKAAEFQAIIDKYAVQGLPGIAILVRDGDGRWVSSAGYADIDKGTHMQPCHVSKIASVTKLFLGTLAAQLDDEGVFSLDDPVEKWVSGEVADEVKNLKGSTLRMLFNHSAGMADVISDSKFYLEVLNNPQRHWESDELIRFVYGDDPQFSPPGDSVEYSNTHFLLGAMAIEKATGRKHEDLIRERILQPLGLSDTYYQPYDALPDYTARGYYDLYNKGVLADMTAFNTGSGNGYGGMFSTVFDMQVFIEKLLREQTLLSPAALQEMMDVRVFDENEGEYYGVSLRKEFFGNNKQWIGYGHRGRDLAYTADLYYFPDQDVTVAWLINYGTDADSDLKEVFTAFRKEMIEAILEP